MLAFFFAPIQANLVSLSIIFQLCKEAAVWVSVTSAVRLLELPLSVDVHLATREWGKGK